MNTILQITKLEPELIEEIKSSFGSLPETNHADGKYRLRKYSYVEVDVSAGENVRVTDLCLGEFAQSKKYNKHQGDKVRKFENIDESVIQSKAFATMVESFYKACSLPRNFQMDVHQMRVKCTGGATQLSPEGWHQDGYDCVAMIGINRNNIIGGEALLSTHKTQEPFLRATLDAGTMLIIDDSYLWHNGRSIQPVDDSFSAWMDLLVFTLKK